MTKALLVLGAVLVLGTVNWQVASKERLRAQGRVIYLDLYPRDPRSIMQGDYMALNFRLAQDITGRLSVDLQGPHVAIVRLDPRGVGEFVRLDTGEPLQGDEMRFRFRIRKDAVWLGTNAFFFHEGDAGRYNGARFAEFRVNEDGEALLIDLRDKDLQRM